MTTHRNTRRLNAQSPPSTHKFQPHSNPPNPHSSNPSHTAHNPYHDSHSSRHRHGHVHVHTNSATPGHGRGHGHGHAGEPHKHNNRRLSFFKCFLFFAVISLIIITLWISLEVISNASALSWESERFFSLVDLKETSSAASKSSLSSIQKEATQVPDKHVHSAAVTAAREGGGGGSFSSSHYQEIRKYAIEEAAKLTERYIHYEERLQRILDREKEDYLKRLAKEEQAKKEKEQELKREYMESKYYMYYEDSNDADSTVIGMTYSQDPRIYKRFVGSLRSTGFGGTIILGIEEVSPEIHQYLLDQNVTLKKLEPVECTFINAKARQKCYKPYPHIKREWAHFPLSRDWLSGCASCSGPVIFTSVDRTFFQVNPFGAGMPVVKRLHLYEQHPSVDVSRTSAGVLLKACVDIDLEAEMQAGYEDIEPRGLLSAATALGTRDDIIDYLGLVYSTIREWMQKTECHFQHSSSDSGMAIVNYLRVKDRLPYRTRFMVHRTGIVNNVDFEGKNAIEAHVHLWMFRGLTEEEANRVPYEGGKGNGWIDTDYMVTNEDGFFIDVFFEKSAIVYGYDSFGLPFLNWLDRRLNITSSEDSLGSVTDSTNNMNHATSGIISNNNGTLDVANLHKRQIGSLVDKEKQKELEGYYIDKSTQEELAKNNTMVERKKDIKVGDTTPRLDKKDIITRQDTMYYPDEAKNVTSDATEQQKVVPVDVSHEKGLSGKNEEEEKEQEQSQQENENAEKNVQRFPVDTKFEIP